MKTNLMNAAKSHFKGIDVRIVLFLLTLVLFILGAGAPGAVGI
jgi:hypothetical protein